MGASIESKPLVFETAAEHARQRVPTAAPADAACAVRRSLEGQRFDSAADVAVIEGRRLLGLVRIEDLLAASPDRTMRELMDADPAVVAPGVDQERAAWHAVHHGEASLAVVDAEGCFHGLVPPQTILEVLLREHHEDLARHGGYLKGSSSARSASTESVGWRFVHRLPWLLVGLAGAQIASQLLSLHEAALQANVALAFFLPGIVYLADAVGTQTETLVVRGLAVGVRMRDVMLREVATGLLVGLVLAALSWPLVVAAWTDPRLAWTVSLSVLASCTVATVVAAGLPWLLSRLRFDPAFGSGPLATIIQDLLSILIYFTIALALVG